MCTVVSVDHQQFRVACAESITIHHKVRGHTFNQEVLDTVRAVIARERTHASKICYLEQDGTHSFIKNKIENVNSRSLPEFLSHLRTSDRDTSATAKLSYVLIEPSVIHSFHALRLLFHVLQAIQDWEAMADLLIDEQHAKNTIFGRSECAAHFTVVVTHTPTTHMCV